MFENILSKENVTFKDFEEIAEKKIKFLLNTYILKFSSLISSYSHFIAFCKQLSTGAIYFY